jgi:hypothetical protein
MRALAEAAGWKDFGHARFLFCRQALWMAGRQFAATPQRAVEMDEVVPCPT